MWGARMVAAMLRGAMGGRLWPREGHCGACGANEKGQRVRLALPSDSWLELAALALSRLDVSLLALHSAYLSALA